MTYPTPSQSAERLLAIHGMEFGGKTLGRYSISRERFREFIAGREKLEGVIVKKIAKAALDHHQLVLIDLGDTFCVVQEPKARAWRPVPAKHLKSLVAEQPQPSKKRAPPPSFS